MYKVSKFNYYTENKNDELLLYNSYIGTNSFFKISKEYNNDIKEILNRNDTFEAKENEILNKLISKGFIVSEEQDEDLKNQLDINEMIYNNNLELIILPTEQCNFRCIYCYESFEKGNMSKEIQDAIIKYVKKNIHKYKALNVSWFGGEPTVNLKAIEYMSEQFIDICKKARKPYMASITTNGYLLTPENMKILIRSRIYNYQITVDGIKETHNKQKPHVNGSNTFDAVITNLINMKNIKTNLLNIIIRTNVTKEIYEILDEYIDYYYDLFNDDKRFRFFVRPVGNWGGESVKNMNASLLDKDNFKLVYNKIIKNPKNLKFTMHNFLYKNEGICYAAKQNNLVIDSQGDIRKCTCHLDENRNKIGKILENGTIQIDKNMLAKWIIRKVDNKCINCKQAGNCLGGICSWKNNMNDYVNNCSYEKIYLKETLILADKNEKFEILI